MPIYIVIMTGKKNMYIYVYIYFGCHYGFVCEAVETTEGLFLT